MEADLYPPDVVMLCPSRVSRTEDALSCETHSPLSSTATSPRGSPTRQFMMMMGGDDDDSDTDEEEPKQQNEQQHDEAERPPQLKKKASIAPFDECRVVDNKFDLAVTRDEKKTDESSLDNYHMTAETFSSYQQDDDKDGDDDAGEPPSLALPVEEPPSLALPVEEPPSLTLEVPEIEYEKKTTNNNTGDDDELMMVPKPKNVIETANEYADAGQPPSLSIIPQAETIIKGIKKPTMVRQRATTTGGIRLRNDASYDDITQKYLNHNLSNAVQQQQQQPNHRRKFSVDSQQKIKFAALKRDIVSTASNDDGEQQLHETSFTTTTRSTTGAALHPFFAVTPDQQLTSPPQLVKKQIWSSDPAYDNHADDSEMTLDHKRLRNIVSPIRQNYSHSPDNDPRYPSFYDTSYETEGTGDEALQQKQQSVKPYTSFSMISPNLNDITPLDHHRTTSSTSFDSGDIPLPTTSGHIKNRPTDMPNVIDSSSENAYDDHKHGKPIVYSEEEMADLVLRGSAGSISKILTSYNHIGHIPLNTDETSSILEEEEEDQVPDDEKQHDASDDAIKSPFHPQGSIRLSRGRSESASNDILADDEKEKPADLTEDLMQPDVGRKKKDLNVSSLFASVVSDATSALTNAAVMSDGACFALEPTTASFLCDAGGGSNSGKRIRRSLEKQTTKASQAQKLALTDAMRKTDVPLRRRSASSDVALRQDKTVPSESADWMKYLKEKGVEPKSSNTTQSSKLVLDWINDGNNKGALKEEDEEGDTNSEVELELAAVSAIAEAEQRSKDGFFGSAEATKTSHSRSTTTKMGLKTSNEKSDAWVQEVEAKLGLKKESSKLTSAGHGPEASSNTIQTTTTTESQHDAKTSSSKRGQQASDKSAAWLQKVEAQLGLSSVVDNSSKDEIMTERYPSITPKKDLQTSDKSAAWLQEEFRRRTTIKQEINDAILARDVETPTTAAKHQFANELAKKLEELQNDDSQSAATNTDHFSITDDEVAALTKKRDESSGAKLEDASRADKSRSNAYVKNSAEEGFNPLSYKPITEGKPLARRLEFHGDELDYRERPKSALGIKAPIHRSVDNWKSQKPRLSRSDQDGEAGRMDPVGLATDHQPPAAEMAVESLDISLQANMRRFVSNTRAALRNDLSGGKSADPYTNSESNLKPHSPFRSLAVTSPDSDDVDVQITYPVQSLTDNTGSRKTAIHGSLSHRSVSDCGSKASDYSDMQSTTPALIQSMDCAYGIAKGDITLSLLNENTGHIEHSTKATWANRVHGAIWRCRRMRRRMGGFGGSESGAPSSPRHGRSSVPVDTNKPRVAGGLKSVASTQDAALNHLRYDEIDQAIELFQDIIFAYYSYFERTLKARELNPGHCDDASGTTDFKPYIGIALHNLGILHLLNGQYQEALSFFVRAVDNRKVCLGEGHRDHVVSLSKLAVCHYALDEFGEAHSRLEEALNYASRSIQTLEDRVQVAEILNNLGCLAYMCGQPVSANAFFRDSLDVHFRNLSESLYAPTPALGQSISLNISISRANIGFVGLVTRDSQLSITALENALMEQQILLHGANETLMATMDHLAVANLLNGDQEKAAMMFARILVMQQNEYGRQDRRCFVTLDKIKMVQSQGQKFEMAVEKLRSTFTMPQMVHTSMEQIEHTPDKSPPVEMGKHLKATFDRSQSVPTMKVKGHRGGLMGVFNSIRKKKT